MVRPRVTRCARAARGCPGAHVAGVIRIDGAALPFAYETAMLPARSP